jgi:hypothetical protein
MAWGFFARQLQLTRLPQALGSAPTEAVVQGFEIDAPVIELTFAPLTAAEVKAVQRPDGGGEMFVEDRFSRRQGLGWSFHDFITRKLGLPVRELERRDCVCTVLRSGTLSDEAPPQTGRQSPEVSINPGHWRV